MNLLHLKYVVEVEKTGSITKAADNLFMGQPNLSKAIKELEASIGFDIFKRGPKGVEPTKQGSTFLVYAGSILGQVNEMESMYAKHKKNGISFSVSVPRASYIAEAFSKFLVTVTKEENIEINYSEIDSMTTVSNVATGEYNLGIIRFQEQYEKYFIDMLSSKGIKYENIAEFKCLALMSEENVLSQDENMDFEKLSSGIEILHGDITIPNMSYLDIKKLHDEKHAHRKIYIYERASQFDILNTVPNTYIWVSPLSKATLDRYKLVQRKCNIGNNSYKDIIICKSSYKYTKTDKSFIKILKEVWNELSKINYN